MRNDVSINFTSQDTAVLKFPDITLFDLFLTYLKESKVGHNESKTAPVTLLEWLKVYQIDSEALSVTVKNGMSEGISVGKFFLETNSSFEFFNTDNDQEYFRHFVIQTANDKSNRGEETVKLNGYYDSYASIPKNIIEILQKGEDYDPQTLSVIKKAHAKLVEENTFVIRDVWPSVLDYLTPKDNIDMVMKKSPESKLSFFYKSQFHKEIEHLKTVIKSSTAEWRVLCENQKGDFIKVGVSPKLGKPALVKSGITIMLDGDKLKVMNNNWLLKSHAAFQKICEFSAFIEENRKESDSGLVM